VTGLINAEESLVNAVEQQISAGSTGHHIRREVRQLINIDAHLTRELTQLSNQGLSNDAVFQQDVVSLVNLEGQLTQILTQLHPATTGGNRQG
jgi:hypothetical protein